MKNKVIIEILEKLIQEIYKHNLSYRYHTDDDYIKYTESVIRELREDGKTIDEEVKDDE